MVVVNAYAFRTKFINTLCLRHKQKVVRTVCNELTVEFLIIILHHRPAVCQIRLIATLFY